MSFDPTKPADHSEIDAGELRNQFNALKSLIDAGVPGPQGPAGATGATGAQGSQGIQGPAGTAGISVPMGGVGAWLKNFPNTPPLSAEFAECNGQVLSDPQSPYDGITLPDLNGASGPQRFLRGASASGGTGGSDTHSHSVDLSSGAGDFTAGTDAYAAGTSPVNTADASSLPSYYEVVYVMRVK